MNSLQTRIALAATLLATSAASLAQTSPPTMLTCAQETDAARRLACFDRVVDSGSPAPAPTSPAPAGRAPAAPPPAAPPAPAASSAANSYGLPNTAGTRKEKGQPLVARVASVERGPRGALLITLDNDQVWQQNEPMPIGVKPGAAVKIKRLLLGSYFAEISGTEGTSVKRVR